jgi:TonB dependent receptor/Carboxypeptidase regulatory-like domain
MAGLSERRGFIRTGMKFGTRVFALLVLGAIPHVATAAEGNLLGWVEDSRGMPVSGVLISAFTKGMHDGGFVAVSDAAGRFFLPSIPPGAYTVRAVGRGHKAAAARQVTVVADQDSIFSITLKALEELTDGDVQNRARELQWLERHKRRSVLEERDGDAQAASASAAPTPADLSESLSPWLSSMSGTLELVASSPTSAVPADPTTAEGLPTGSGVVRLKGRLGDIASFTVGGLVAENGSRSWRMAGEFVVDPGGGHEIVAGAGYGTRLVKSPTITDSDTDIEGVGMGAVFAQDRWSLGDRVALTGGLRSSYIGFSADGNHLDPMASVEFGPGRTTRVHATFAARTLAPGGDMLALSPVAAAPAISYASTDSQIRAERTLRYEVAVEQILAGTHVSARTFREDTQDQLINAFSPDGTGESLRIYNGRDLVARGGALEVSRSFGGVVKGTVTYTSGQATSEMTEGGAPMAAWVNEAGAGSFHQVAFHDVTAQIETAFGRTGTRIVAYCRVNSLQPHEGDLTGTPVRTARFDVRLSQGLPFMGSLTGADWDVLLAFRNLFYEPGDGALLDEVSVVNPPKRVSGGISVRF